MFRRRRGRRADAEVADEEAAADEAAGTEAEAEAAEAEAEAEVEAAEAEAEVGVAAEEGAAEADLERPAGPRSMVDMRIPPSPRESDRRECLSDSPILSALASPRKPLSSTDKNVHKSNMWRVHCIVTSFSTLRVRRGDKWLRCRHGWTETPARAETSARAAGRRDDAVAWPDAAAPVHGEVVACTRAASSVTLSRASRRRTGSGPVRSSSMQTGPSRRNVVSTPVERIPTKGALFHTRPPRTRG